MKEELEDTKAATISRKSKKDRQHNGQKKSTREQTTIYKTVHRNLKIDQYEPH